jgi:hypothetical protein
MTCRSFIVNNQVLRAPLPASIAGRAAPAQSHFRRKTAVGEAAVGAADRRDQVHLLVQRLEVKHVGIFRQPLEFRRPRNRGYVLLQQPAQSNLDGGLVMPFAGQPQRLIILDAAF